MAGANEVQTVRRVIRNDALWHDKRRAGFYKFPEAGEGFWSWDGIQDAFLAARRKVGLRREHEEGKTWTQFLNSRLVADLHYCGHAIKKRHGRMANDYRILFPSELALLAVETLKANAAAQTGE